MTETLSEEYLDRISKQKQAYDELDRFEKGDGGLQYYPIPVDEWKSWKKEQDKKTMEDYEKKQKKQNNIKEVLEIREEIPRSNGHDKPQIQLNEGNPTMTTCNYCNNPVGKCNCKENPKFDKIVNPDHCDLKKKPNKKRVSKPKK